MSTFSGNFLELPNVSADNFTAHNLKSTCFFLSHCHTDHMKGLLSMEFINLLTENSSFYLYCSSISKLILQSFHILKPINNQIKVLSTVAVLSVPASNSYPSYQITVSSLSAGHCPGSLMLLFESSNQAVLYTGDFRIAIGDICKFRLLRDNLATKKIDSVYLDSTFFCEKYWKFSSRQESIDFIIDLTRNWLNENPAKMVQIKMPANYGGETILMELSEALNHKIHVSDRFYNMYLHVSQVARALTKDCSSTRIHSSVKRFKLPTCNVSDSDPNLLTVMPCAMSFPCKKFSVPKLHRAVRKNIIKVNYSSHSSCSEIIEFLNYIRPKNVTLCTHTIAFNNKGMAVDVFVSNLKNSWHEQKSTEERLQICAKRRLPLANPLSIVVAEDNNSSDSSLDSPPLVKKKK